MVLMSLSMSGSCTECFWFNTARFTRLTFILEARFCTLDKPGRSAYAKEMNLRMVLTSWLFPQPPRNLPAKKTYSTSARMISFPCVFGEKFEAGKLIKKKKQKKNIQRTVLQVSASIDQSKDVTLFSSPVQKYPK